MLRTIIPVVLISAAACAAGDETASSEPAALTTDDIDIASECAKLLVYTNIASFATLDAFLPSNVAQLIVDTAAVDPFNTLAELLAVNGVGPTRLQQLLAAARAADFVTPACDGIYDNLGVSVSDAAAIVDYVDTVSEAELRGVLSFLPFPESTVPNLLAGRPYATVGAISNASGVGPATFRALRNAATVRGPFEDLVEVVDSINHPDGQVRIQTHFDWREIVANDRITSITCFGIPADQLPPGTTIRSNLADSAEVHTNVSQTVSIADRFGEVSAQIDPAEGLANLAARTAGLSFAGCFVRSSPNPFVFDVADFFLDLGGRFSVLSTIHAVE